MRLTKCLMPLLLAAALLLALASPAHAHGQPLHMHVTLSPAGAKAGTPTALEVAVKDPLGGPVSGVPVSVKVQTEQGRVKQRLDLQETGPGIYRGTVTFPTAGSWVLRIDLQYLDELQETLVSTVSGANATIGAAQGEWDTVAMMLPLPLSKTPYYILFGVLVAGIIGVGLLLVRAYRQSAADPEEAS